MFVPVLINTLLALSIFSTVLAVILCMAAGKQEMKIARYEKLKYQDGRIKKTGGISNERKQF